MPEPRFDERRLLMAELDHDALSLRGVAEMDPEGAVQHFVAAAVPEADWTGKLATWTEACVTFYLDSVQLHDMLFHESRAPTREGLVDNVIIDHLTVLLTAGAAAGAWSIDDPRFTAVFLFSGMHGVVDDAYLKEKRIVKGRLISRLQQICFAAVGLSSKNLAKNLGSVSISKSETA